MDSRWNTRPWYNVITYSYVNQILAKAARREPLSLPDLPQLAEVQESQFNMEEFTRVWEEHSVREGGSSSRAVLARVLRGAMARSVVFTLLWGVVGIFVNVFIFAGVAGFLGDISQSTASGWLFASLLAFGTVLMAVLMPLAWFQGLRLALRAKSAWIAVTYNKATRLADVGSVAGTITNLVANDAEKVFDAYHFFNWLIGGSLLTVGILVAIGFVVGVSIIPGAVILVLIVPVLQLVGNAIGRARYAAIGSTDRRMQLLNEIISSILMVKIFAWESAFGAKVAQERAQEIRHLKRAGTIQAITLNIMQMGATVPVILTFIMYLGLGEQLTLRVTMTTLALVGLLWSPFGMFSLGYTKVSMSAPSYTRLDELLRMPEFTFVESAPVPQGTACLNVSNVSFSYPTAKTETEPFSLRDLNMRADVGEVLMIVGEVAAGKSTMLSVLVGLHAPSQGSVDISGSVAFVPQDAFLVNDTLRANIIFGSDVDEERYARTLQECCLLPDLEVLPEGDSTLIGEKGVNLSGGQKARISLARAIYSDRQIIVMDDFLSAVDARVGNQLVSMILSHRKDKVIVFASHQMQYAHMVDRLIVMDAGRIVDDGSMAQLEQHSEHLAVLMNAYGRSGAEDDETRQGEALSDESKAPAPEAVHSVASKDDDDDSFDSLFVSPKIWARYFGELRPLGICLILGFIVAQTVVRVIFDFWLSWQIDDHFGWNLSYGAFAAIWVGIFVLFCTLYFLGSVSVIYVTLNAAQRMFNATFDVLLHAPQSFFDTTPVGSILNRLGGDTAVVDVMVAFALENFVIFALQAIAVMVVVAIASPWFLIAVPVLLLMLWQIVRRFRAGSRMVRRVDGITREPLYATCQQTLVGLSQLAVYGRLPEQRQKYAVLINNHLRSTFCFWSMGRWFNLRTDLVSGLVIICATFLSITLRTSNPEIASLAIVLSMRLSLSLQWSLRNLSELEANLTAVERMTHYIDTVEPESQAGIEVPADWPTEGRLDFCNVDVRYGPDLPLVIKDLSFSLRGGQKAGIVGRTGAGKSSLVSALFRLVPVEQGSIRIDGINVADVPLRVLRSRISFMPQATILFSGTVASNLSPFGEFSDEKLLDVLQQVELDKPLDFEVDEEGKNLSLGERQKLCIARALIKSCKILVLDEASAQLSTSADAKVQEVFSRSRVTTLTIAHRLNTIIQSDRVLFMESGERKEYGPPGKLVQKERSMFKSLVQETGAASARFLFKEATSSVLAATEPLDDDASEVVLERAISADFANLTVDIPE